MTPTKQNNELRLVKSIFSSSTEREKKLVSLNVDLCETGGKILLCVYRNRKRGQLTAVRIEEDALSYSDIRTPRENLTLPDSVLRNLRRRLRSLGIRHIIGVCSAEKADQGTLLIQPTHEMPLGEGSYHG